MILRSLTVLVALVLGGCPSSTSPEGAAKAVDDEVTRDLVYTSVVFFEPAEKQVGQLPERGRFHEA